MTPKLSNLNILLGYWKENSDSWFSFQWPKTMFKLDNFGVILFVSFSHKKLLQCSFYENWKNRCKNRFFRKKFKKVCVLQRRACTQIQNFKRNYLENYNDSEHAVKTKNAPFFMIFPNILFSYACNLLGLSFMVPNMN